MADECCQKKSFELAKLKQRQSETLWVVLGINAVMFVIELVAGIRATSLAKGLIMFGSAIAVFARAIYQVSSSSSPEVGLMSLVGLLALGANIVCLLLPPNTGKTTSICPRCGYALAMI